MIEDLRSINKVVEGIMADDIWCRDDDTRLLFKVWAHQGFTVPEQLQNDIAMFCVSAESITRCRRKIQERGKYRGKNYAKRQAESGEVRDLFVKGGI